MKQDVAVISLDAYAGQFYAQQVQELFGERITVCSYSVRDGSIEHMPRRYDLYMVTTDAFDSLGNIHQYVPIDGEMMESTSPSGGTWCAASRACRRASGPSSST